MGEGVTGGRIFTQEKSNGITWLYKDSLLELGPGAGER